MNTFYLLNLLTENAYLIKPNGMIPYGLIKYGYDSYVACYDHGDYDYLNNEVKGLKIKFVEKKYKSNIFNIYNFLKNNSRNINILMVFNMSISSLYSMLFFRLFNKKGIVYVRLDADEKALSILTHDLSYFDSLFEKLRFVLASPICLFFQKFFVNILNVETKETYKKLADFSSIYKEKLVYTPNGIQIDKNVKSIDKKNQIITVGRLGTYQKATEILLEAFKKLENKQGWVLKLVGTIEDDFKDYIQNYFEENPELKKSVIFMGNIVSREDLSNLYAESKVFCLPSRFGSFELVLAEAAYFENYIISTNVGVSTELLDLTNYGALMKMDNVDDLTDKIQNYIDNENQIINNLNIDLENIPDLVYSNYSYESICEKTDKCIQKELNKLNL